MRAAGDTGQWGGAQGGPKGSADPAEDPGGDVVRRPLRRHGLQTAYPQLFQVARRRATTRFEAASRHGLGLARPLARAAAQIGDTSRGGRSVRAV